jgi:hypothetical protein
VQWRSHQPPAWLSRQLLLPCPQDELFVGWQQHDPIYVAYQLFYQYLLQVRLP